jgi:hypothetical protein
MPVLVPALSGAWCGGWVTIPSCSSATAPWIDALPPRAGGREAEPTSLERDRHPYGTGSDNAEIDSPPRGRGEQHRRGLLRQAAQVLVAPGRHEWKATLYPAHSDG